LGGGGLEVVTLIAPSHKNIRHVQNRTMQLSFLTTITCEVGGMTKNMERKRKTWRLVAT